MNGWDAFRIGLSRALRYWWVLLILFAVNLASALPLAVLPAMGLAAEFGHRPAIHQAADGVDAWLVIETLMSPLSGTALGGDGWPELTHRLQQAALLGLATAAVLPLLVWLPAAFLSGGVLLTYTEAPQPFDPSTTLRTGRLRASSFDPSTSSGQAPSATLRTGRLRASPFRWRRFLWGCWHWFGAFLLLDAVQGVASSLLFVPITAAGMGAAAVGGWLMWVIVPLLALIAALWLALVEYARIVAVVGETRNVVRAFGKAVRFVFRRPLPVAGLYGLALLLLALLHALYHWGLMPHLPLDWWLLALVVQQTFILARLWARLVRMAGGVALYQELAE